MSWEVSGSGLGMFLDRFGKVLKKMSDGVRKLKFSKMARSIFPESGRFRIVFLTYPRSKNNKISKIRFLPQISVYSVWGLRWSHFVVSSR